MNTADTSGAQAGAQSSGPGVTVLTPAAEPAPGQVVEFAIGGMTCGACAARIERRLNRIPGVRASVNYATSRATCVVTGSEASTGPGASELIAQVERTGYTAHALSAGDDGPGEPYRQRIADLRRRLIVAVICTVPLCDLSLLWGHAPGSRIAGWQVILGALAAPVVTWCAWPFHREALRGARRGATSMDTLVSVGVLACTSWSVLVLTGVAHGTGVTAGPGGWLALLTAHTGLYLEVAATVVTILLVGRLFEAQARRSAVSSLRSLSALSARTAVVTDAQGRRQRVPAGALAPGNLVVTSGGQTLAADGVVVSGQGTVDTARMTGESEPLEAQPGTQVLSGTVVISGELVVRAERTGTDTQLAQMVHLVERTQAEKARSQQLADRVAGVFVPVVLVLAVLTAAGWLLLGGGLEQAIGSAAAVLVIACPCALGLATPAALMVASGTGADHGILIRSHRDLENARAVDTVVLDKTGTLTLGRMTVADLAVADGVAPAEALALAGAVEAVSEHPIAQAITRFADAGGHPPVRVEDATEITGLGVSAQHEGALVLLGAPALLDHHDVAVPGWAERARAQWSQAGHSVAVLSRGTQVVAVLAIADTLRPGAAAAVAALKRSGRQVIMLTGDHPEAAHRMAQAAGIHEVVAGLLPAEKAAFVARLRGEGRRVAMVGDGVNDAAALSEADLGLSIGTGTEVARTAAGIILMRDDLTVLPLALDLSRSAMRTIRLNLIWAFGYNVAAIPVAMAGLLSPLIAGAAMCASSLFVLATSLRLRSRYPVPGTGPHAHAGISHQQGVS